MLMSDLIANDKRSARQTRQERMIHQPSDVLLSVSRLDAQVLRA